MELIKLVSFHGNSTENLDGFSNNFFNLSIPSLPSIKPTQSRAKKDNNGWNVWSKLRTNGNQTLQSFLTEMNVQYGLQICLISYKNQMLFFDHLCYKDDPIYNRTLKSIIQTEFPKICFVKLKFCKLVVTASNGKTLPHVFCYFN